MKFASTLAGALMAGLAWNAHASATVETHFLALDRYTDIGWAQRDQEDVLKQLGDHVGRLGEKGLADGQTLSVDFVDITLAGRPKLTHRSAGDFRVLTGQADWPRIRLHWVLRTPGAADRSGDADLADMNYLQRPPAGHSNDSLSYEKRMLDGWFKKTFANP